MSASTRLAFMIALVAFSPEAPASEHGSVRCMHHVHAVRVVNPNSGHTQWAYAAGVYMMDQDTGLLYGDQAAISRFSPNSDGIDFLLADDKACSPMPELLSTTAGWRPTPSITGQLVFERTPVRFGGALIKQGMHGSAQS